MALSVVGRDCLGQEGLESINYFADFKYDQLYQAINKMRTSIPSVAAVLGGQDIVVVPVDSPITPCTVSAKCALRVKVASLSFHNYHAIGRDRTPANMNNNRVLRTFYIEWEALIKLSKDTKPAVPHLYKNTTPK